MTGRLARSILLAVLILLIMPAAAHACTSPSGDAGDILYNADHAIMQWCDGDEWIGLPKPEQTSGWISIETNSLHSCGVRANGEGYCWGRNGGTNRLGVGDQIDRHSPARIVGGHLFSHISPGYYHTCGLARDGQAWCWGGGTLGDGTGGTATAPVAVAGNHTFTAISSGSNHTCGIDQSGHAWCWGTGTDGQLGDGGNGVAQSPVAVVGEHDFTAISGGDAHTCALDTNGAAWCWGKGQYGRLGGGNALDSNTPVAVAGDNQFQSISAGGYHSCAINLSNRAMCWGRGNSGQLGNASTGNSTSPALVSNYNFRTVTAGNTNSCGIGTTGLAYCWGAHDGGQNGNGLTSGGYTTPSPVSGGRQYISVFAGTTGCALNQAGNAWCWGLNTYGNNGDGTTTASAVPVEVIEPDDGCVGPAGSGGDMLFNADHEIMQWCGGQMWVGLPKPEGLSIWTQHSAGSAHNCGVQADGTAWCYGNGQYGKLGNGTEENTPGLAQLGTISPARVGTAGTSTLWDDWVEVVAGSFNSCGIRTNGTAWCWGTRYPGMIGDGSNSNSSGIYTTPVQVGNSSTTWDDWTSIIAPFSAHCGLRSNGTVWCWGSNQYGLIGDGSSSVRTAPRQVGTVASGTVFDDWISISGFAQATHACGLRSDGSAWCWGNNERGQLGNETRSEMSRVPVRVGTSDTGTLWNDWVSIDVGNHSTCGLRSNGTVWCWGSGKWGISPHDPDLDKTVPTRVGTSETGTLWSDWVRIDYSHMKGCGWRSNGTVWCWGYLDGIQNTPVPFPQPSSAPDALWSGFSMGWPASCAMRTDGSAWCWYGYGLSNPLPIKDGNLLQGSCLSPSGVVGDVLFNDDHAIMQWCDGYQWIGFPKPADTTPPVWQISSAPSAKVGDPYTFTLHAIDETSAVTYTTGGRPAWLSLNTTTGELTGTPPPGSEGTHTVVGIAADAAGNTTVRLFSVIVEAPPPEIACTAQMSTAGDGSFNFTAVANGGGLFVAVGDNGAVMTSPDGLNWTSRGVPEANWWTGIAYGGGLFVAVSSNGTNRIATSPDGIIWTARTAPQANVWTAVTYGDGQFVAVANSGTHRVMTSPDGITWTAQTAAAQAGWSKVTYGNGRYVAVVHNGTGIMSSSDGVTWTAATTELNLFLPHLTFGNGLFLAGAGNQIITSPDGTTWSNPITVSYLSVADIASDHEKYIGLHNGGPTLAASPDGVDWQTLSTEAGSWVAITYANGRFVGVGRLSIAIQLQCEMEGGTPPQDACETGPVGTPCSDGAIYAGELSGTRLYAAPADASGTYAWKTSNSATSDTTSTTDGLANTNAIATAGLSAHPAGQACRSLGEQWYLPAQDELDVLEANHAAIGGFGDDLYYWSSTERSGYPDRAYMQLFGSQYSGFQGNTPKITPLQTRCIRR